MLTSNLRWLDKKRCELGTQHVHCGIGVGAEVQIIFAPRGGCLERQNLAQQKCAQLCHGILRSAASFLGVIVSALGMHISLVPVPFPYRDPLAG